MADLGSVMLYGSETSETWPVKQEDMIILERNYACSKVMYYGKIDMLC